MQKLEIGIICHRALLRAALLSMISFSMVVPTFAGAAETRIHLTQKNGYFEAQEVLTDLNPGEYDFLVTNASGKNVGFQVQSVGSGKTLVLGLLKAGETKSFRTRLESGDHRYRCPINPTPWYEFGVGK